ncbi:MAG: ABC transporter permease [Anaerolineae bacterium]
MNRIRRLLIPIAAGCLFLLFILPLFALTLRSLQTRAWEASSGSGVPEALILSLLTTSTSALLVLLTGTPLAYLLARHHFRFKQLVTVLVELPIVLPPAVAGLGLLIAFGRRGLFGPALENVGISLPFTTAAVIIAQIFVAAPFYVRAAQVGFQQLDMDIEDAARVDGAGGWTLFRLITLPLARRSLAAGLAVSWTRALGEFGATILFAGSLQGRTQTMPLLVYNVLERNINAAIWTGLLLVAMASLALFLARHLGKSEK